MDLSKLSTEDLQALRAGDLGRVSTQGLQELQRQQVAAAPQTQSAARAAAQANPVDNTMGMSRAELAAAGVGKAISDVGASARQGVSWLGNKLGVVSDADHARLQAELDEQARIDRRLMDNGAALAGNVAAQIGAAFIPGTGQLALARKADALWKAGGAANIARSLGTAGALGAAQNVAMNPRTGDDSLLGQGAGGMAAGAVGQLLAPALSAGVQFGRHVLAGPQGQAGRAIGTAASAGRPPDAAALRALAEATRRNATEIVPGSLPTAVQAADNAGISQLARNVQNRVQGGALAGRAADQNAARLAYLGQVAPIRGTAVEAAEEAGRVVADESGAWRDMLKAAERGKYQEAMDSGIALQMPAKRDALGVLKRFYPRGPVAGDPHASTLHAFAAQLEAGAPVPLAEFDALRKQAGNKARALSRGVGESDPTAAAAWGALKDLFDGQEVAAIARSERLRPTGQGPHGPVFGGLSGDWQNAAAHLYRTGTGEVPSALAHADVPGPISLVYGVKPGAGVEGSGVAKLVDKHPEVLQDLPGFLSSMRADQARSGPNRIRLTDGDLRHGVVRLDKDSTPSSPWLLTAFEKQNPAQGGVRAAPGARTDTAGFVGGGDTARPAGIGSVLQTPPGAFGPDWQEAQRLLAAAEQMKAMPAIAQKYRGMAQALLDKLQASGVDTGPLFGRAPPAAPALPGPDIAASFRAFDQALNPPPPPRDPRQYVGDLAGAMTPEQAAPLSAGRALHAERKSRFDTGPAGLLWRTGADGAPRLEGAEVAKNFFHGGANQAQAVEALNRIALERGPGKQAMRSYAMTDLVQQATNAADTLSPAKYERWVEQRAEALKGLLSAEQLGKVKAVLDDLKRADKATNAGRAVGSNTEQNKVTAGVLGGAVLDYLASRVRYVGPFIAGGMRDAQRTHTAGLLDAILADPTRTAAALDTYAGLLDPNLWQRGLGYAPAVANPLTGGLLGSLQSQPNH